jgi:hypothetical protein
VLGALVGVRSPELLSQPQVPAADDAHESVTHARSRSPPISDTQPVQALPVPLRPSKGPRPTSTEIDPHALLTPATTRTPRLPHGHSSAFSAARWWRAQQSIGVDRCSRLWMVRMLQQAVVRQRRVVCAERVCNGVTQRRIQMKKWSSDESGFSLAEVRCCSLNLLQLTRAAPDQMLCRIRYRDPLSTFLIPNLPSLCPAIRYGA